MADKYTELPKFRGASVTKKGLFCRSITPLHCACINPDSRYLEALIAVGPDTNVADENGWKPIHYAAACTGIKPLELLISKGVSMYESTKQKELPIHIAAQCGRLETCKVVVKALLDAADTGNDSSGFIAVFMKLKTRSTYTALHLAVMNGHFDVVKFLVKTGADIEYPTGAGKGNLTALMLAARYGHMDIASYLVDQGAKVNKRDKLKRTALCHAVMTGTSTIASFLLKIGACPDLPDSSGNTPAHYAAAYAWWSTMDLLMQGSANLNCPNDWKLTPLAVAYLKGHMGMVDYLLDQPSVDVNCQDDNGVSLVSLTCQQAVEENIVSQLKCLIDTHKADVSTVDSMGNTPMHHLATACPNQDEKTELYENSLEQQLEAAKVLVDRGSTFTSTNEVGVTPFMVAVVVGNLELAHFLLKEADEPCLNPDPTIKANTMNDLFTHAEKCDITPIFKLLIEKECEATRTILQFRDSTGHTPFLNLCQLYKKCSGSRAVSNMKNRHFKRYKWQTTPDPKRARKANMHAALRAVVEFYPNALCQQVKAPGDDGDGADLQNGDGDDDDDDDEDDVPSYRQTDATDKKKAVKFAGFNAFHILSQAEEFKKEKNEDTNDSSKDQAGDVPTNGLSLLTSLLSRLSRTLSRSPLEQKSTKEGYPPLFAAMMHKQPTAARILINAGADVEFIWRPPQTSADDDSVQAKQPQKQAKERRGRKKSKNEKGQTPRDMELITSLDGRSVLMAVLFSGLPDLVDDVLRRIKDADLPQQNMQMNGFDSGAGGRDNQSRLKAVVTTVDAFGNSPLHYAALQPACPGIAKAARLLIKYGSDPNGVNRNTRTALHLAAHADTIVTADVTHALIECLLESGADPAGMDKHSRIPLHYAFVKIGDHRNGSAHDPVALTTLLVNAMRQTTPSNMMTNITNALATNGQASLDAAHRRGVNQPDRFGNTPLVYAAQRGASISCLTLLRHGAVVAGLPRATAMLQSSGSTLSSQQDEAAHLVNTPLAVAVLNKHMHTSLSLIQAGADICTVISQFGPGFDSIADYWKRFACSWAPARPSPPGVHSEAVCSGIVRNEWQGILYVIVDMLEMKSSMKDNLLSPASQPHYNPTIRYYDLIKAALEHRKLNLAHMLIHTAERHMDVDRNQKGLQDADSATLQQPTLVQVLAKSLYESKSTSLGSEELTNVMDQLARKMNINVHAHSREHPHAVFWAARAGNKHLLDYFIQAAPLPANQPPNRLQFYANLPPDRDGLIFFTSLFYNMDNPDVWKANSPVVAQLFAQKFILHPNYRAPYPAPHFCASNPDSLPASLCRYGDGPSKTSTSTYEPTLLIHAIIHGNFHAAKQLVQLGAEVNMPDTAGLPPMIHAVRTNNIHMVQLLLDPSYEIEEKKEEDEDGQLTSHRTQQTFRKRRGRRYFGGGKAPRVQLPPLRAPQNDDEEEEEEEEEEEDYEEEAEEEEMPEEEEVDGDDDNNDVEEEEEEEEDAEDIYGEDEEADGNSDQGSDATDVLGGSDDESVGSSEGMRRKKSSSNVEPGRLSPQLSRTLSLVRHKDVLYNDASGRSVLAYLINPLPVGSWENTELLDVLKEAGVSLDASPDIDALLMANQSGLPKMVKAIEERRNVSKSHASQVLGADFKLEQPVTSGVDRDQLDPKRDADAFVAAVLAERKANPSPSPKEEDLGPKPHRLTGYVRTGVVVTSDVKDAPYDVVMTKVDVEYGYRGIYNFYRIQLVKRRASELYVVFTQWGRIGYGDGQYQRTPFGNREDAAKEFEKIFRSKTGNSWKTFANGEFEDKTRKYRIVSDPVKSADDDDQVPDLRSLPVKLSPGNEEMKLRLPQEIQEIIVDLADVKALKANTREISRQNFRDVGEYDTAMTEFGCLKRSVLESALEILIKVKKELEKNKQLQEQTITTPTKECTRLILASYDKICDLSNEFFAKLPFAGFDHTRIPVIDECFAKKCQKGLEALFEMETAGMILAAATYSRDNIHPLDYIYAATNTEMEIMNPADVEAQYILRYIYATSQDTNIRSVIKLSNSELEQEFAPKKRLGNRKLLWHGTSAVNLLSILSVGLKPAPIHAIHTGSLFGKGIYTADTFAKSKGYCNVSASNCQYALLCEVALGSCKLIDRYNWRDTASSIQTNNSVQGFGQEFPDPRYNVTLPTGCVMPLGPLKKQPDIKLADGTKLSPYLDHNEFVVYDASQVIPRYLIVFDA